MSNGHVLMNPSQSLRLSCVDVFLLVARRSLGADSPRSSLEFTTGTTEVDVDGTKSECNSRSILRFDGSTGTSSSFDAMEISLNNASLCFSHDAEDFTSYSSPELPNSLAPFLINLFTPKCFNALIFNVVGGTHDEDVTVCTVDAALPSNREDASVCVGVVLGLVFVFNRCVECAVCVPLRLADFEVNAS